MTKKIKDTRQKNKKHSTDPHFERESLKYDNPIPSREFILSFLESAGGPLKFLAIQNGLSLFDDDSIIGLQRRLGAMVRDGQIHCDRRKAYGIINKLDLESGRIIGHKEGFGFFVPDSGEKDWFISAKEMRRVFPGEKVLVREKGISRDGKKAGAIVEIIEGDFPLQIVGRYFIDGGLRFVRPEDSRIAQDILIPPDDPLQAKNEQVVVIQLTTRPTFRSQAVGRVVEVLGDYLAPGMEIEIAIAQYGIRNSWNNEIHDRLKKLPTNVSKEEWIGRKDLRDLPLITIDGEDARDFDDAVYCKAKTLGGWTLYVAIADVSHYVKPDDALDLEAILRGNSVYFPNSVVPMLPEQISNGLCSLKPEVDRLCMVCELNIKRDGTPGKSTFYPAVMHSKARMTYTKVWDILDGDSELREEYKDLVKPIEALHKIYQARIKKKKQRGAIEFETTETQIIFNENKKIDKILPVVRNDAHKLIEECMILANVASAQFFINHKVPGIYRVHNGPKEKKLEVLRSYLSELGLSIPGGSEPEPSVFRKFLETIQDRPDAENIQIMLLRSMSQAVYSPENQGHFGLAFDAYTHFTSPIRRYPDLIVHRIIKSIVADDKIQSKKEKGAIKKRYTNKYLAQIGQENSITERNADVATRDVMDWLKCEYMQSHIGNSYQGEVSSITNFGLFIRLKDVFVEGLIHVTELGEDYFHFDQAKQKMIGERTGKVFAIGDILDISVAKVDMDLRRIDFSLKDSGKSSNKGKNKSKKIASSKTESKRKPKSKAKVKSKSKKQSVQKDPVQNKAVKNKKSPRRSKN
ncbi:MAG: ribonuclease R [Gammaproteobacteria bacterium]|nr:MAG: ribonuclease R [Gammaproteobacteria bacterium]